MEYRRFNDTYVLRLDPGEEIISCLKRFSEAEKILSGKIEGIGACGHAEVGLYDIKQKVFHNETFDEPFEITSIVGNISTMNDEVYLHIHITMADEEHRCFGGHLYECRISATAELFITVLDGRIGRKKDE